MATVLKQSIKNAAGVAITYTAASGGGDAITEPGPDCVLHVKNGSGSSINVTLVTPGNLPNGDPYPDKVLAVPAGQDRFIAVGNEYRDSSGLCSITWSATTTVTFAALSTV